MNLVCRKSKIRAKTSHGLGEGDKPSGQTGDDCLAGSPRSERSGKRPTLNENWVSGGGGGGAESTCLALLYN